MKIKSKLLVIISLLLVMPFAFAQTVYKPMSETIIENTIDVNGSVFDINYNVNYPSTAVFNINNHGDSNLELHLIGEHTSFYTDDVISYDVYAGKVHLGVGGVDYSEMGSRPSCASTIRGQTWFTERGTGQADQFCICKKDRYGGYNWVNIARDDNVTGYTC
jgi:hypothetical protein